MARIVGVCGLVCSTCSAYLATQANSVEALDRVVAEWTVEYNNPRITRAGVICDGCVTPGGRRGFHCGECDLRACAVERGLMNCAECDDYACERLERFFGYVPTARAVLDEIRAGLDAT